MGSHQLITVPDYNCITITSNNPLRVVWNNYSAWLNKMADTWWSEETKLLIALWSEEAVQHELDTMHNKKLVWDKISQGMAKTKVKCLLDQKLSHPLLLFQMAYFSSSSFQSFHCLSSGLQIVYCGECHGSCSIGRHFVFNFRLRGYSA